MLFEGNEGIGFTADAIHGTTDFATVFRNLFTGWETGKDQQTVPIHLYTYNRYVNVVGNVLGRSGYHNRYETAAPSGTGGNTAIYTLGWSGNGGTTDSGVPERSARQDDALPLGQLRCGERRGCVERGRSALSPQPVRQSRARQSNAARVAVSRGQTGMVGRGAMAGDRT